MFLVGKVVVASLKFTVPAFTGQSGDGDDCCVILFCCGSHRCVGKDHFRNGAPSHMWRLFFHLFLLGGTVIYVLVQNEIIHLCSGIFKGFRHFYNIIRNGSARA